MAEHRDASVLVLHRCEDEEHTRRFFFLCTARTKISQSQTEWHEHWRRPAKDTQGQRTRRSSLQLFLMPCCPLTYKFTFYACKIPTTQTHTHTHAHTQTNRYKWHEAGKAGWTWGQVSAWTPSSKPVLPFSAHRPFQTGQSSERPTLTLTLCGRGT